MKFLNHNSKILNSRVRFQYLTFNVKPSAFLAAVLGFAALVLLIPLSSQAAPALTIGPPFQEVVLAKDQPKASFELMVGNSTDTVQTLRLTVRDFGSLDESGGVAFLGTTGTGEEHKYGLASWLQLGADTVTVAPGATSKIIVTVDNRESLSPGGHYGAILLTTQGEPGSKATPQVVVTQVLSSLVLVKKVGGENYNLLLNRIESSLSAWRLPPKLKLRFQNSGNVHVVPRGIVEITDPGGRLVSKGTINPESGIILPESFRLYPVTQTKVTSPWLPGRYMLKVNYRYDGQSSFQAQTQSFYYLGLIGLSLILAVILLLSALALLTFKFIKRRPAKPHKS